MWRLSREIIAYAVLFAGLIIFVFCSGGLFVTFAEDKVDPATTLVVILGSCAGISALFSGWSARYLLKCDSTQSDGAGSRGRRLTFSLVLFFLLVLASLVCMNITASFFAVPWPMNGLHGVSREVGKKAWNHQDAANNFTQVNSWGQRDREHALLPVEGSHRLIMVGDSFLEDGAAIPLPVRLEEKLKAEGMPTYEVINLGVSATAPDEYFFRIKSIGLPLRPQHCLLFIYSSNDFIQEPSLKSFGGIVAPYPRDSFLQHLGLGALNHVISNRQRPILRAWFEGGELLNHELKLAEKFRNSKNDAETEATLLGFFPTEGQTYILHTLQKSTVADRSRFYEMLRHPDEGKFRSYYLNMATRKAMGEPVPQFIPAEYAFRWVWMTADLCRKNGVTFTLVVIPDGFSVDQRMVQQWQAICDMKGYMKHMDDAADRLVQHAANEGIEVVDLRSVLNNKPGTYLNMDGHWTQYGVDIVAGYLAGLLKAGSIGKVTTVSP